MEEILDRLIQELTTIAATVEFTAVLDVDDIFWDDPMVVVIDDYPYMYVEPVAETPRIETMGRAGHHTIVHTINVGIVIVPADHFDSSVSESSGSRALVKAMAIIRKHFRRLSKSQLDGLVRKLTVTNIQYVPDVRDETFVRVAVMTLAVERQYQNEE